MALSVAELAEVIRRPEVDRAAVVERLRHWTSIGMLEPEGDLNPGTGKRREYDDSAIFAAAILNALADLGIPIGKVRYYMVVLLLAQRAQNLWAKKRSADLYLEVADFGRPNPQGVTHAVFLHEGGKRDHLGSLTHPRSEGSLILPVSRLFARIEKRMKALRAEAASTGEQRGRRKSTSSGGAKGRGERIK
jgi:DNA-binding transcriptional MerR regulator